MIIRESCWILLISLAVFQSANALELPHVILMMGDDHGWEETGYNGHPHVKTPNLDQMAAKGLRLDRFHSAHPSCSPTRASFLTGRHPNRMGTFQPGYSIRPEEISIAHLMKRAGYRCAHFGKWHVGAVKKDSPVNPGAMGFDYWLSHDNFFELNPTLSRNGNAPERIEGESSAILVQEAIEFLESSKHQRSDQPLFTVIWFGSPHEPYSGLPDDLALYDDLPGKYADKQVMLTSNETGKLVSRPQGQVLRERYAEITAMDRAIGRLRDYLAQSGLRDNTLLFYCGDNGTSADGLLKSPHRGHKGSVYQGGTLVPGLVEWPEKIAQPMRSNLVACTSDLMPTLAAVVGQSLPQRPLDGINLIEALESNAQLRPMPLCFWEFDSGNISKSGREPYIDPSLQEGTTPLVKLMAGKYTRDFVNFRHPSIQDSDYRGSRAIIDGQLKLVVHDDSQPAKLELFDLQADPGERNDLSGTGMPDLQRLADKLRIWQLSVLNSLMTQDYR